MLELVFSISPAIVLLLIFFQCYIYIKQRKYYKKLIIFTCCYTFVSILGFAFVLLPDVEVYLSLCIAGGIITIIDWVIMIILLIKGKMQWFKIGLFIQWILIFVSIVFAPMYTIQEALITLFAIQTTIGVVYAIVFIFVNKLNYKWMLLYLLVQYIMLGFVMYYSLSIGIVTYIISMIIHLIVGSIVGIPFIIIYVKRYRK